MNNNIVIILVGLVLLLLFLCVYSPNGSCQENFVPLSYDKKTIVLTQAWVEHLVYTILVFMAFFRNSPELKDMQERLLKNQKDIGYLVGRIYGDPLIGRVTEKFLTQHILIAVELLKAIKNGQDRKKEHALTLFYDNAYKIGEFMDGLQGTQGEFVNMMKKHIDTLVSTITAFVKGQWKKEIGYMDQYLREGTHMGFMFGQLQQ